MKNENLKMTPGQFAQAIGKSPQWVSVYIKRNKLKKDAEGYIDLQEPVNKLWLQQWQAKGNDFDIIPGNGKKQEGEKTPESHPESSPQHQNSNYNLDKEKKETEIKHIRARTKNENIKFRKHSENLVTREEAKQLFEYATKVFYESYIRNVGRILSRITDEIEVSEEQYMNTRSTVENALAEIHSETRKQLMDGLKNLAESYSEVRQRGEHK